jgi:gluconate 2-dehydrogenase gamma chain
MTADTFSSLINSDRVTNATRKVLLNRLQETTNSPAFFTAEEFALLRAVTDCLVAQQAEARLADIATMIDNRLAAQTGPGWRFDELPADGTAYQIGLKGINESVLLLQDKNFIDLSREEQNNLLKTVQQGDATGETWKTFSPVRFFELMLTETAEHFYSHPAAQEEIKYNGFADAEGWQVPKL